MSRETEPIRIDIPDAIRSLKIWFAWRWAVQPDGKKFKLPVQPNGRPASSTGRETWNLYEKAASTANAFEGLAIGLGHQVDEDGSEWNLAGIDLDGCFVDGGGLKDWAAEVLARVDSYAEFSPSGKGVHILVRVSGTEYQPGLKLNLSETEHIEFYSTARYFTFTGNHVPGTSDDVQPRAAVYDALRAEFEARRPSSARTRSVRSATKPATAAKDAERRVQLTDAELLDRAQAGPSGEAFKRLYEGDMADYREDHSAADMALAGRLAFWTGKDPEQMDRLFRDSGLMRAKWDTRRGLSTYGEQTIEIAISNCEDVYSGSDKASESFVEKLKAKRAAKVAETQKVGATVKAGNVKDHERGSDKAAHGKKVLSGTNDWEHPSTGPVKRSVITGRAMEESHAAWPDNSDGTMVGDLFGSETARVTNEAVATVEVQRGHMDGAKPTQPSPAAPSRVLSSTTIKDSAPMIGKDIRWQQDLFSSLTPGSDAQIYSAIANGEVASWPALSQSNGQNGDGAHENVRPEETVPLPAQPSKASEYVALSDVDYTLVEEPEVYAELTPHPVDGPDEHALTDDGNFMRFRDRYEGMLIFTKSNGWMRFDGAQWLKGDEYAVRAAAQVSRDIVTVAITDPRLSQERKTALAKHGIGTQSVGRIHGMANLASAHAPFTHEEKDLDRDPMLLNTPSGTLNLKTGELQPHDPLDLITKSALVDYDPDAQSDLWMEVIAQATAGHDGLAEFLQRAAGYTLTGMTTEDAVFFLHGPGGTAKSSIGEAMKAVMGSYATSMRSEALTTAGNSGHSDDIARLVGARMVITGEADKVDKMRDGLFKRLSGGDTIDASRKGKTGFNFRPQFKMWFITNTVPALNPDDSGIWRRVFKLPFDHVIKNPDRRVRLALQQDPQHQRAILAWMVKGAAAWRQDGLGMPAVVREATELLRRSMDGLADFFEGRCYFNTDEKARLYTSSKDLMEAYTQWANEEGLDARFRASARRLGVGLMARGCTPRATMRERGWMGVIVREDA